MELSGNELLALMCIGLLELTCIGSNEDLDTYDYKKLCKEFSSKHKDDEVH